jgi:predicted nucleic acid-binding protein
VSAVRCAGLALDRVVIDASVAIKWLVPETHSDQAALLLDLPLFAPELLVVECANYLRSQVGRAVLPQATAQDLLRDLRRAPITLTGDAELAGAALAAGLGASHAVYDCLYYALAVRLDGHVVTADRRFRAAIARLGADVDRVLPLASVVAS